MHVGNVVVVSRGDEPYAGGEPQRVQRRGRGNLQTQEGDSVVCIVGCKDNSEVTKWWFGGRTGEMLPLECHPTSPG